MRNKLVRQHFLVSFSLLGLDDLQYIPESLVGDDVGLGHTSVLVKGTEGKTAPAVAELDAAIGVCMHAAALAAQSDYLGARFDQLEPANNEIRLRRIRDQPRRRPPQERLPKRPRQGELDSGLDAVVGQGHNGNCQLGAGGGLLARLRDP